jgi:hypothetical protein
MRAVEESLILNLTPLCIEVSQLSLLVNLLALGTTIIVETPCNDRRIQV